ncbi:GNAT family N-acetyltransferase [Klebsiella variicola]|uniref:GNAT family N-acetyltransferase n=1 Tax=Klebsiella variicola TaxID=244366 RepID=UPI00315A4513
MLDIYSSLSLIWRYSYCPVFQGATSGKKLDAASSYQYGPICVAEEYRGQGVGELLLAYQRKVFAPRYPVIVTFVNVLNPRSYAFHTRNQFEDVGFFNFNGNKYHMMALPTS